MRLVWAQHALADRDAIFTHIEAESPRAAVSVTIESSPPCSAFRSFQRAAVLAKSLEPVSLSYLVPPSLPSIA